jgi:prepilin-type N-terminal cleavage/methylation domain-containing protein/prepilin-type processing-associated H-X9-DG protein
VTAVRRAFTLVELLVVIAIIALLISILAPSLQSAKDLVKQAICLTNVRSIAIGINLYAEANRGSVPPHYMGGGLPAAVYYTFCAFKRGEPIDPNDGLIGGTGTARRSFAWVYTVRAVTEPSLFYCPSSPVAFGQYKTYPRPWGSVVPLWDIIKTNFIRTSYMYNPNVNNTATAYTVGPQIGTFDNEHAIALDLLTRLGYFSHTTGGYRWNAGFADGHAAPKSSGKINQLMQSNSYPDADELWPDFNLVYGYLMEKQ